jgi:hypothetical protein
LRQGLAKVKAGCEKKKHHGISITLPLLCLILPSNRFQIFSKTGECAMQLGTIDTNAATAVTPALKSGVCAGTTVMTLNGETLVEHLSIGERVITRDSGMAILKDIRKSRVNTETIRIKAGSLGHTRPDRDMIVAPGARIHIRDWRAAAIFGTATAMVPAQQLVDGEYLSVQRAREMDVYELIFDRQHIIYADGVELVTG